MPTGRKVSTRNDTAEVVDAADVNYDGVDAVTVFDDGTAVEVIAHELMKTSFFGQTLLRENALSVAGGLVTRLRAASLVK